MNEDDMCQADQTIKGEPVSPSALQSGDGGEAGKPLGQIVFETLRKAYGGSSNSNRVWYYQLSDDQRCQASNVAVGDPVSAAPLQSDSGGEALKTALDADKILQFSPSAEEGATDIVDRLRYPSHAADYVGGGWVDGRLDICAAVEAMHDAAFEIERLRVAVTFKLANAQSQIEERSDEVEPANTSDSLTQIKAKE